MRPKQERRQGVNPSGAVLLATEQLAKYPETALAATDRERRPILSLKLGGRADG